jgi:glycine/D-amino acid oxidase-like deaminating enzyme
MTKNFDVILIGGGMLGLSTAYNLAKAKARVLLLEAGEIGGGSSAACAGRAQVAEGKLDEFNLTVIREGFEKLETLDQELGYPFEFRKTGLLVLINSQQHWDEWSNRVGVLTQAGIPAEMLDSSALQAAEPHLNTAAYWGAARAEEGWLNPFQYCWAFATAAQRYGATLLPNTPVTKIHLNGRYITAVEIHGSRFEADKYVVMCGAWTRSVLQLAGVDLPIHFTHAQAFVTDPLPIKINHTIALANFYDLIHGKDQAVAVGFNQDTHGNLIVTEAVEKTADLHRATNAWGLAGISTDLLKLYPGLANTSVVRSWGIPTPFTPDEEPVIGWAPGRANLFVAAGFMQTITAIPIVSPWMAQKILGKDLPVDLSVFSPARFCD